jgi:protein-glutamine gamma-glutamyltransferase
VSALASGRPVRLQTGAQLLPAAVARGVSFLALVAFGALHWMVLVEPPQPGRAWLLVGLGALAMLAMLAAARLPGAARPVAAVALVVPLAALGLLAGGVADELLRPDRWSELAGGISRGIADLPGARVPYRGLDQWVQTVIPLGASALVLASALLAFWPRRGRTGHPVAALVLLFVLYAVPAVALNFRAEFLRGALLALLVLAYLRLEKLRVPDAAAAATLALLAALAALIAAPVLNRDQPWFDYETWALETSASKTDVFTWDHSYRPLTWPRDGREMLRVKARFPAYWKAENLDEFDGFRWRRDDPTFAAQEVPANRFALGRFTQRITVSVRNLRSDTFITAGFTSAVDLPHVDAEPTMDGAFSADRTLGRGDTYTALVYAPEPTERELAAAGSHYPASLLNYRTIFLPLAPGAAARVTRVTFPAFGVHARRFGVGPPDSTDSAAGARALIAASPYARTYALAQRLRKGARTPAALVARVKAYLSRGFGYSESPPPSADNLDGFLFDAKQGYCQQFSGAMALLLRMAGIPARVSAGFTSGAFDSKAKEYVVRDLDAHSWVEVWFPGWGWVTEDPTPAAAPARNQPDDSVALPGSGIPGRPPSLPGDSAALHPGTASPLESGTPWWEYALIAAAALAAVGAAAWLVHRRRGGALPALSELERALHRSRRELAPGTTLQALEALFARTPAAAGYVRALRDARYGVRAAHPTRAQRRGLRAELARGSGLGGRLRAWWALPPR